MKGFRYLHRLESHLTYTFPPLGRIPPLSSSFYGNQKILPNIKVQPGSPDLYRMGILSPT